MSSWVMFEGGIQGVLPFAPWRQNYQHRGSTSIPLELRPALIVALGCAIMPSPVQQMLEISAIVVCVFLSFDRRGLPGHL